MKKLTLLLATSFVATFANAQDITGKGNKVYILAMDKESAEHATNAINHWGYWQPVSTPDSCDFTLKLIMNRIGMASVNFNAYAEFIDPKTNATFRMTEPVNNRMNGDMNSKRGVINKLVKKRLQSEFK